MTSAALRAAGRRPQGGDLVNEPLVLTCVGCPCAELQAMRHNDPGSVGQPYALGRWRLAR